MAVRWSLNNLRTLIVMLDQFVLTQLIHLPEIPAAQQKAGAGRGRAAPSRLAARGRDICCGSCVRKQRRRRQTVRQRQRSARMISPQQIQERRRDELLRRQLGPQLLAAIADPTITDIIVNEDGRVWFEAHGKGLYAPGFSLPESQRESLIGTVAAALGTGRRCRASDRRRRIADRTHPFRGLDAAGGAAALLRDAQAGPGALHTR